MKAVVTGVAVAFQFLTIAPPLLRRPVAPNELGRSVTFFPLVGLAIGLLLFGLHRALSIIFPEFLAAAILLGVWTLCSGALHFDGILDTVDGLLGGRDAEDRLRIMRDARVGSFAVAAGGTVLLLKFAAIGSIGAASALVVAPVAGRWLTSMAVVLFSYARPAGLGRDMKDNAGWPQAAGATAIAAATIGFMAPSVGIAATGAAVVLVCISAWILVRFTLARIPGLTGDIYGALCEVGETVCLVTLAANWSV
ncbi:MAG: adenosylcobinamide-GDP ribazoletransferase [Caldilineaceae bacterium]|nr:adenosylcobinamide-GDP ribazoletransferase [Caldilineaceae bacterium]